VFDYHPWLRQTLAAEQAGFPASEAEALRRDGAVCTHGSEGETILFRTAGTGVDASISLDSELQSELNDGDVPLQQVAVMLALSRSTGYKRRTT
jgi:hypothetical protein